ncbi:MAG: MFS transporter [Candidatus Aminicenantales bacterium]
MKSKILFSASLFHALNDAASVTVPMIFPLLYQQKFIIKNYFQIGLLSNLGLLITLIFQAVIVNLSHKYEYRHILCLSVLGISLSLLLITFSSFFATLLISYLLLRMFVSFYHPVGIAWVSKTHPDQALDFAMGIQSGSGNLGVLIAFVSSGFLAQGISWKTPMQAWAVIVLFLGFISFFSIRKTSTKSKSGPAIKHNLSSWIKTLASIKFFIPGFVFGGACWGTTVFFAPSLFNHKFQVPLGKTGIYLASWIGIGSLMTYIFGFLSRKFGRWKIARLGMIGSSFFLFGLGLAKKAEVAQLSLLFFGAFLFLLYPAFQSFVGNKVPFDNQAQAFSLVANIQMLTGATVVLIDGFLSDKLGISSPFILMATFGTVVAAYYLSRAFPLEAVKNKAELYGL